MGTKDARKFSYIFSDAIDSKKLYDSISIQTFYDKGAIDMQSLLAVTFAVKYRNAILVGNHQRKKNS